MKDLSVKANRLVYHTSSNTPITPLTGIPGAMKAFQKTKEEDKPILLSC